MRIPIDTDEFNALIQGATGAVLQTEMDGTVKVEKKTGRHAYKVNIAMTDPEDLFAAGKSEILEIRIFSDGDPGIVYGPIRFGNIKAATWEVGTKNGIKNGISFSADTWTQTSAPSTAHRSEPAVPVENGAAAKK